MLDGFVIRRHIKISQQFDSGAIDVISADTASNIELNIRQDSHADFTQWFHFRLQGARDEDCTIRFLNAGKATYPKGFEGYQVAASYDSENWFRVPTAFDGTVMTVNHMPEFDSVYYAYFQPYSWERHLDLIAQAAPDMRVTQLGSSLQGRDIDKLSWGSGTQQVWIIARQHPGESMTEWLIEVLV